MSTHEEIENLGIDSVDGLGVSGAKRNKRRGCRRGCLWTLGVFAAILLVAGGWLTWVLTLQPTISVNYLREINAVPIEARAAGETAWEEFDAWNREWLNPGSPLSLDLKNDEESRAAAWAILEQDPGVLEPLRHLARHEFLGWITTALDMPEASPEEHLAHLEKNEDPAYRYLLPFLGRFRMACRVLELDAQLALEQGDMDRALRDLESIQRLGEYSAEHPVVLSQLVSLAIWRLQTNTAARLVGHARDEEDLDRIARSLERSLDHPTMNGLDWTGERLMFRDFVQRTFADGGEGRFTVAGKNTVLGLNGSDEEGQDAAFEVALGYALVLRGGSGAKAIEIMDEYYGLADRQVEVPFHLRRGAPDDDFLQGLRDESVIPRPEVMIANIMFPYTRKAIDARVFGRIAPEAVLAVIAIEKELRRAGSVPSRLEELVPDALDSVPIDPFTGQPLVYRVNEDGSYTLYSVGNDLDDDGGRHIRGTMNALRLQGAGVAHSKAVDGDWVFWLPAED